MVSEGNKKIAKNTLILYLRVLILMIVSLYTSRIVLNALGVEDFGIYNVVGGVVALFSVITGTMSATISRFITFELGANNEEQLRKIFSTSISIQILLAILIVIFAESLGVWFLNNRLIIPLERIYAANCVFQFTICTFIINLISVPYNATIIAHEKMTAFAYISIIDGILKLVIAFLIKMSNFDGLIVYALLLALEALLIRIVYGLYCRIKFTECRKYKLVFQPAIFVPMLKFSGWNMIGTSSGILRIQGINIMLNLFFGTVLNAAQGIANQVNSAVMSFISTFTTALNPPITKSFASGDKDNMITLVLQGARFSYYLLFFIALPLVLETNQILSVWLVNVPLYTAILVKLTLILALCEALSQTLITALLATGNIRNYQIIVGGINLLNLPISYFLLWLGYMPQCTLVVSIVLSIIALIARLLMLKYMIGFSIKQYLKTVISNILIISILAPIVPCIIRYNMDETFFRFFIVSIASCMMTGIVIYYIALNSSEKKMLRHSTVALYKRRHDRNS